MCSSDSPGAVLTCTQEQAVDNFFKFLLSGTAHSLKSSIEIVPEKNRPKQSTCILNLHPGTQAFTRKITVCERGLNGGYSSKFLAQKVRDTEKRVKRKVHSACSEMSVVCPFARNYTKR